MVHDFSVDLFVFVCVYCNFPETTQEGAGVPGKMHVFGVQFIVQPLRGHCAAEVNADHVMTHCHW